jgi:hypothetical protein
MAHTIGIVLSIIGLWLAGAGIVGDSRLREWEAKIRAWIRSENAPHRQLMRWAARVYGIMDKEETRALHRGVVYLRNIFAAMMLLVLVIGALSGDQQLDSSLLNCFVPPVLVIAGFVIFIFLILVLSLASYLLAGIAWIVILPYHLLDRFAERARLQSTLVVVGLILGSLGILLTG